MKFYKINFVFAIVFYLFFLVLATAFSLEMDDVGLTFFINLTFGCIFIGLSLQKNINTILFFYIFNLIFFVFTPWIHYTEKASIWSNVPFQSNDYLLLNFIIFFINILVFVIYFFTPNFKPLFNEKKLKEPRFLISIFVCLICFFIICYSVSFNYIKLVFRGVENDDYTYTKLSPIMLILAALARILPAFIFLRFYDSKNKYKKIILFIFVLLCAFPTSIPRFSVAYIYLPILLNHFTKLRKSVYVTCIMIFSIFLIFPFLNQFRYFSNTNGFKFIPEKQFFIQGHFDAYQNFMDVIRVDFITYGYQLLGVLLFFVPRSVWKDKPVGSGYQLAENNNYIFNNISMPFLGEGYVNFGYFGVIFFAIFLAIAMKQIDVKILLRYGSNERNFNICVGVFFCAGLFFIFRGDLMSSFSYMLSGVIAYKIAKKI